MKGGEGVKKAFNVYNKDNFWEAIAEHIRGRPEYSSVSHFLFVAAHNQLKKERGKHVRKSETKRGE